MSKADQQFVTMCRDILDHGTTTEGQKVRPVWEDGTPAYTIKNFGVTARYDLREEFPALTLRRTALKSAMDEILWIYQKKSNNVHDLNSHIWDEWADETGSIGKAYGYQIGQKSHYAEGDFDQMDRVLYDLNTVWVEIEKRGRSFVIKDSERVKLDHAYLSALKRLGLTPAAACGIQSLLTPKTLPGQTAPEENAPAANPQPKQGNSQPTPASATQRADQPATRSDSQQTQSVQQSRAAASRTVPFAPPQSAARQRTDCYVVLNTKVQGGMSGSSTLVTLRAPDGKQIPAFARGARPELSAGTVLSNVKLTMRQQDTVAFYVLESYEIVPQEDRAA